MCEKSDEFCHDKTSRALIFKENQANVTSIEGAQWMISYNRWQTDAASQKDSAETIAARGDLEKRDIWQGKLHT